MISPWTIYQEKKQKQVDMNKNDKFIEQQDKKGTDRRAQTIQKIKLVQDQKENKQQQNQNENQLTKKQFENKNKKKDGQFKIQEEYKSKQAKSTQIQINESHEKLSPKSNKRISKNQNSFQPYSKIKMQEKKDHKLFQNQPQQHQRLSKSKQFLKNVIPNFQYNNIDNHSLLEFSKHKKSKFHESLDKRVGLFGGRRKSTIGQKLIVQERENIYQNLNYLVVLSFMKVLLRSEDLIQKEIEDNIVNVMKRLNPDVLPRINPQQELLNRLLKKQEEKMMKKHQEKKKKKQDKSKNKSLDCSTELMKYQEKINIEQPYLQKINQIKSNRQIQQNRQQKQNSSIIKYNSVNSSTLQKNSNYKQKQKQIESLQTKLSNSNQHSKDKIKFMKVEKKVINKKNQKQREPQFFKKQQRHFHQKQSKQIIVQSPKSSKSTVNKNILKRLIQQHIADKNDTKMEKYYISDKNGLSLQKQESVQASIKQKFLIRQLISHDNKKTVQQFSKNKAKSDLKKDFSNKSPSNSKIIYQSNLMGSHSSILASSNQHQNSRQKTTSHLLELITNNIIISQKSKDNVLSKDSIIDKLFSYNHSVNKKNQKGVVLKNARNMSIQKIQNGEVSISVKNMPNKKKSEVSQIQMILSEKKAEQFDIQTYNFKGRRGKLSAFQKDLLHLIQNPNQSIQNNQLDVADKGTKIEKQSNPKNQQISNQSSRKHMDETLLKFSDQNIIMQLKHQVQEHNRIKKNSIVA